MKKYNVIIPVYNSQNTLDNCLQSLLKQNFDNYEIVLVDDGSSDNSGSICDDYQKNYPNIKVIHQKNAGVSVARRNGVLIADCEYLLFVDSDDMVTDDYFAVLEKCQNADIIKFGYIVESPNQDAKPSVPIESEGFYNKKDIINTIFPYLIQSDKAKYYTPSLWSHAFKKDLFVNNMVTDEIQIGEDGACVIPSVYHANSMFIAHSCLYVYKYNSESATKKGKVFDFWYPLKIRNHLYNKMDIDRYDFSKQMDRKIVHELLHVIYSQFEAERKYGDVKKDITRKIDGCAVYKDAIKNARFSSLSSKAMHFAIKYRMYSILRYYSKIRR